jgi:hypothetical protein
VSAISQVSEGDSITVEHVAVLQLEHENDRVAIDVIRLLPARTIFLDLIGSGCFRRSSGMDGAHVRALAAVANFSVLPPILVQRDGLRVIDGAHRLTAARACGQKFIRARVVNCTDEDAYILAVAANTQHGLPLSHADSVSSARRILHWHPDWPDRAIASATGLRTHIVARLRLVAGRAALVGGRTGEEGGRPGPAAAPQARRVYG